MFDELFDESDFFGFFFNFSYGSDLFVGIGEIWVNVFYDGNLVE